MIRFSKFSALAIFIILGVQCRNTSKQITPLTESETESYMKLGEDISNQMLKELMRNVSAAIEKGGTDYAVTFCNVKAVPLTDSVSSIHNVKIQRLSDKNRNPQNEIKSEMDSLAWQRITSEKKPFLQQDSDGKVYYYRPIVLAMPACIKCHGTTDDIADSTESLLREKYPFDKATNYQLGDMRGMWKLALK